MTTSKKLYAFLAISMILIAGCATADKKNHVPNMQEVNNRINAIESESQAKDRELEKMRAEMRRQEEEAARAEADRRELEEKIAAQKAAAKAAVSRPNTQAAPPSDLK